MTVLAAPYQKKKRTKKKTKKKQKKLPMLEEYILMPPPLSAVTAWKYLEIMSEIEMEEPTTVLSIPLSIEPSSWLVWSSF